MILAALTSRLVGPAALAGLILSIAVLGPAKCENGKFRRQAGEALQARDEAVRELGACQSSRLSLESAVEAQSAAMERLREESEARAADLEKQLQAARKTAQAADRRATRLEAFRPASADVCAALLEVDGEITR